MEVKLHRTVLILSLLSFTAFSYAGLERFWKVSKEDDIEQQFNECDHLTKEQQQQLISTYQSIRDEEQQLNLKNRMDWFCQLSNDEQQRMRIAWQNMSTQERNAIKKKLQTTTDLEKRAQIRRDILSKYSLN
ncbi:hypothetical protein [Acinetobacter populi]|jgi:predicted ATPase with chaperone activity|uniref:Restriction endonuclease n=1 Tax=Acinetobacter populi TaxID=1582270 RepID=A0A1Z9Z1X8_9GAMM|nr:hypothetical protein [Acinetobacter populi]MCH4246428.1 DUF3106 domain-containing protein [Acinetobacter populi]OUY08464.1 hypothetical protein CAP51_02290 [Acinetobacter populi]